MMRLPKMEYLAPSTLSEVSSLLSKYGEEAKVLAGGTDLLAACKLRNLKPSLLISLRDIPALRGLQFDDEAGLRIGAMTNLNALRYDPLVIRHYPALSEAAAAVGTTQLQNMGTLGGNLCLDTRCMYYNQSESWRMTEAICLKMDGEVCDVVPKGTCCYAAYSGDLAPALMALKARVKLLSSAGERTLSIGDLYTGDGRDPFHLRAGEIIQEVRIPPPASRESSTYLKYRVRGSIDFPLAGVAVRLASTAEGLCRDCTVVVNAVSPAPTEATEAAEALKGKHLSEVLINQAARKAYSVAHPVANTFGARPSYRRKMIEILTRRALNALAQTLSLTPL